MNYDEAVKKWAGKRLDINPSLITRVDFGMDTRGYCETCSYDVVGVEVSYNIPNTKNKSGVSSKHGFIDLGYETFAGVLQEILEIN